MSIDEKKLADLMRKIRALKAKAEDPSTTEEESMAFAAKVAEMMSQYGLEEAQLVVEEQSGIEHTDEVNGYWSQSPYRKALLRAVCTLYHVTALSYRHDKTRWTLVGRKHNVIIAKEMTEYLLKTTIRLSNEYARKTPGGNNIDFRRGCMIRLAERIHEIYRAQAGGDKVYNPQGNPGNLPALYASEEDLIQRYMREKFGKIGMARKSTLKYGVHGMAGRKAADGISLNAQMGNASKSHLLGKK